MEANPPGFGRQQETIRGFLPSTENFSQDRARRHRETCRAKIDAFGLVSRRNQQILASPFVESPMTTAHEVGACLIQSKVQPPTDPNLNILERVEIKYTFRPATYFLPRRMIYRYTEPMR